MSQQETGQGTFRVVLQNMFKKFRTIILKHTLLTVNSLQVEGFESRVIFGQPNFCGECRRREQGSVYSNLKLSSRLCITFSLQPLCNTCWERFCIQAAQRKKDIYWLFPIKIASSESFDCRSCLCLFFVVVANVY